MLLDVIITTDVCNNDTKLASAVTQNTGQAFGYCSSCDNASGPYTFSLSPSLFPRGLFLQGYCVVIVHVYRRPCRKYIP